MKNKKFITVITMIYQFIEFFSIISLLSFLSYYIFLIYKSNETDLTISNIVTIYVISSLFVSFYTYLFILFLILLLQNAVLSLKFKIILFFILINPFILFLKSKKEEKSFRYKRINTKDIILLGLFLALYIVATLIVSFYQLPQFIEVPIGYGILMYYSFNNNFIKSFFLCLICSLVQIPLPGIYFMNFFQYYFDYGFIILSCSLVSILKFTTDNKLLNMLYWLLIIMIVVELFYLSRIIGGVLYWFDNSYAGYLNRFTYSVIFNFSNIVTDFVLLLAIVPITCKNIPSKIWD